MTESIAGRFNEVAAAHPDLVAVIGPDRTVSYARLAGAAGAVAHRLGGGGPVALRIADGVKMVVAILGTLAAGRVYVPLDPAYPAERLRYMTEHSGAAVTLTDDDVDLSASAPMPLAEADDAYILYTSGSTGRPKGVVQTHRNVLYQALGHVERLRITPADRVSVLSSFSYDMAVTDTFSALLSGAAAVPVDVRHSGMTELAETLARTGVTIYHSTPTVFRHLLDAVQRRGLPAIRAVVLGGEKVNRSDVDRARAACSTELVFVNGYGATEISFVAQNHIRPGDPLDETIVPIGHPLPGCEIELSEGGEIVVTSDHIARYWGTPTSSRRYPTGDAGTWLPDGKLAYLGRLDRQIKLRGYRIEPAEIEHALTSQPGVREAAVTVADDMLVAYVAGRADVAALRATLPDFMIPARFVELGALPLTPTGKVDLLALPAPGKVPALDGGEPQTVLEKQIAAAWCAILGAEQIGRDVNFFDAGGDSLRLGRLQRELESQLGTRVPLTELFAHPTVAALASHLDGTRDDTGTAALLDRMARRRSRR